MRVSWMLRGRKKPKLVMEEPCCHAGTTTIRRGGNGTSRYLTCATCDQHLVLADRRSRLDLWRYFFSVIFYLPRGVEWCRHMFCQGCIDLHARGVLRQNRKAFSKPRANLESMKVTIRPLNQLLSPNVFPQIGDIDKTDYSLGSEKSTCGKFSGYTFAAFLFLLAFFIRYLLNIWIRCA